MIIRESDTANGAIVRFMEKKLSGQYTFRIPLELEAGLWVASGAGSVPGWLCVLGFDGGGAV